MSRGIARYANAIRYCFPTRVLPLGSPLDSQAALWRMHTLFQPADRRDPEPWFLLPLRIRRPSILCSRAWFSRSSPHQPRRSTASPISRPPPSRRRDRCPQSYRTLRFRLERTVAGATERDNSPETIRQSLRQLLENRASAPASSRIGSAARDASPHSIPSLCPHTAGRV